MQEIPEAVFREALLNALTHRDYFADTEHIFVHMHPGRMVITSPGGLPQGLTLEELGTRSVPRKAFDSAMEIFELTKKFCKEETYSLTDQIRRASRSVCSNSSPVK